MDIDPFAIKSWIFSCWFKNNPVVRYSIILFIAVQCRNTWNKVQRNCFIQNLSNAYKSTRTNHINTLANQKFFKQKYINTSSFQHVNNVNLWAQRWRWQSWSWYQAQGMILTVTYMSWNHYHISHKMKILNGNTCRYWFLNVLTACLSRSGTLR